jgi:hypothetical protein
MSTATCSPSRDGQEREPLFLRLDPDRLPLLRLFEDERDFAVVRPRPPLDEPLPLDELLPPDELLRLDEERPRELDEERPRELDAEDLDLRDGELRLRELDEERFFTSPSSILPRQDPLSSSSIVT